MIIALAIPTKIVAQSTMTGGQSTQIVNAQDQNSQMSAAQDSHGELTKPVNVMLMKIAAQVMTGNPTATVSVIQRLNAASMLHSLIITLLTIIVFVILTMLVVTFQHNSNSMTITQILNNAHVLMKRFAAKATLSQLTQRTAHALMILTKFAALVPLIKIAFIAHATQHKSVAQNKII